MTSYYVPSESKKKQLEKMLVCLKEDFSEFIIDSSIDNNEVSILVTPSSLVQLFCDLRDGSKYLFKQLIDITAVDHLDRQKRFEVVYFVLSLAHNMRLKIKVHIEELELLDTLSNVYTCADWLEREVYDMFGIYFKNHPDLRRILTDFGFEGHPLRKDFPLTGFVEVEFDESAQKVVYKPVELRQDYRDYSYNNPWMDNIEADTFNYLNKKNKTD